jgi:recombination protein RecT
MNQKATAKNPPKVVTPIDEVRNNLVKMEDQFKKALPPQINAEKFVRVAMTALQQNPDLLLADRHSLYGACMKSAQDGLLPDAREAALVIYNTNVGTRSEGKWIKKVQYMPMIAGILKKVRNSGELASISPHVVYDQDEFSYWIDECGEHLKHQPKLTGERGTPTHVYAIAKTKQGEVYIEVMTKEEVEQVRSISRAKESGPWNNWWGEMARKTVIRRLSKRLPMSTDLEQVIRADDALYDLNKQEEVTELKTKPSRLAKLIQEAAPETEVSPQEKDAPEVEVPAGDESEPVQNFEDFK